MRIRLCFTKAGKVRFLSHRDLARVWERALRRAELPISYTEGFSPRPKVHFGLALSTGYESLAEYLDVDLDPGDFDDPGDLDALALRLSAALPAGVDCVAAAVVDRSADSLQQAVTSCTWSIAFDDGSPDEADAAIDAVLAAEELLVSRERKGRTVTDDIRPYVLCLQRDPSAGEDLTLLAELGTQPRALRPAELVRALGDRWQERRVCRLHQWIHHDGQRLEPLAPAALRPSWARTEVRAS